VIQGFVCDRSSSNNGLERGGRLADTPITKYMVCMRGSYPVHGSFFNIAEPPG